MDPFVVLALVSVAASLWLLRRAVRRLARRLVEGSYIARGMQVLGAVLAVFIVANLFNGDGFIFPTAVLAVAIATALLLGVLRRRRLPVTVVLAGGAIYLGASAAGLLFLEPGAAYFDLKRGHALVGALWLPFFLAVIIDHTYLSESLTRDTTRTFGYWAGLALTIGFLSGLNHAIFSNDTPLARAEVHVGALLAGGALLVGHVLQTRRRRTGTPGWEALTRHFWPRAAWLVPVALVASGAALWPLAAPREHWERTGERGWDAATAEARLANPRSGLIAASVGGDGMPVPALGGGERIESCGGNLGCHVDIQRQWQASAHRFAADPAYRAVVAELVRDEGVESARLCASCHDPVALLSGEMRAGEPYPTEASPGVTCVVCHTLVPASDVGDGRYRLVPQPGFLQADVSLVANIGPYMTVKDHLDDHSVQWDDGRLEDPALCGSCHELSIEGLALRHTFAEWRAGRHGPEGEDPRSCIDCHMPEVGRSPDTGALFHDHSFRASNVALAPLLGEPVEARARVIASAIELRAHLSPDAEAAERLEVVLTNRGGGHGFPSGPLDLLSYRLEHRWLGDGEPGVWQPLGDELFRERLFDAEGAELTRHQIWNARSRTGPERIAPGAERRYRFTPTAPPAGARAVELRLLHRRFRDAAIVEGASAPELHLEAVEILRAEAVAP